MAQHIKTHLIDHEAIRKIEKSIRGQRYFKTSMKFNEITDEDYKETLRDEVYITHRNVPNSIVTGGRATFEVHTTPAQTSGRLVTGIYLVA